MSDRTDFHTDCFVTALVRIHTYTEGVMKYWMNQTYLAYGLLCPFPGGLTSSSAQMQPTSLNWYLQYYCLQCCLLRQWYTS